MQDQLSQQIYQLLKPVVWQVDSRVKLGKNMTNASTIIRMKTMRTTWLDRSGPILELLSRQAAE